MIVDWPAVLDGARALSAVAVGEVTHMDAFDRLCREADRKAATRKKNPKLERLRELMADDVSLERAWHELRDQRPSSRQSAPAEWQRLASLRRGIDCRNATPTHASASTFGSPISKRGLPHDISEQRA
jgi:hypothetical protein